MAIITKFIKNYGSDKEQRVQIEREGNLKSELLYMIEDLLNFSKNEIAKIQNSTEADLLELIAVNNGLLGEFILQINVEGKIIFQDNV